MVPFFLFGSICTGSKPLSEAIFANDLICTLRAWLNVTLALWTLHLLKSHRCS